MGIRGEIFSTKVNLQNRTYFFNVKENRLGDLYLNIVESKNRDTGGFDRQSVILFADDLGDFLKGFDSALKVLEKAVREKKRGDRDAPAKEGPRYEGGASGRESRPREGKMKTGPARRGDRNSPDYDRPRKSRVVRTKKPGYSGE
jgi:hypothetical protein